MWSVLPSHQLRHCPRSWNKCRLAVVPLVTLDPDIQVTRILHHNEMPLPIEFLNLVMTDLSKDSRIARVALACAGSTVVSIHINRASDTQTISVRFSFVDPDNGKFDNRRRLEERRRIHRASIRARLSQHDPEAHRVAPLRELSLPAHLSPPPSEKKTRTSASLLTIPGSLAEFAGAKFVLPPEGGRFFDGAPDSPSCIIFIFRRRAPRLREVACYATGCLPRATVSAILSEFMRRVMRFEDAILSFLQSLSSSTELAVYSPAPSLSLSLSLFRSISASLGPPCSLMSARVGPGSGYQLVDLPCQPRGCGSEASELSWQAITLSNSRPKTRV